MSEVEVKRPIDTQMLRTETSGARAKAWDECQIEERIERLRREMREVRESMDIFFRSSARNGEILHQHTHGPAGDVLVRAGLVGERPHLNGPDWHDPLK